VIVPLTTPDAWAPVYATADDVEVRVTLPLDSVPLYSVGDPVGGATTMYIFGPLTTAPSVAVGLTAAAAPADWVPQYVVVTTPSALRTAARLRVPIPGRVQLPVAPVVVKVIVQVAGGVVELLTEAVLPVIVPDSVIGPLDVVSVTVTEVEDSAWRTGPRVMSVDTCPTVMATVPLAPAPATIP
jgi:hypothetical protein